MRFKARAEKLAGVLGASGYKIVKLNLGHIGSHIAGGELLRQNASCHADGGKRQYGGCGFRRAWCGGNQHQRQWDGSVLI